MTTFPAQKNPDGRDHSRDRPGFKIQHRPVDQTNQGGALTSPGPGKRPCPVRTAPLNPQSAIRNPQSNHGVAPVLSIDANTDTLVAIVVPPGQAAGMPLAA